MNGDLNCVGDDQSICDNLKDKLGSGNDIVFSVKDEFPVLLKSSDYRFKINGEINYEYNGKEVNKNTVLYYSVNGENSFSGLLIISSEKNLNIAVKGRV